MTIKRSLLAAVFITLLISACYKSEQIPSYITIDKFDFQVKQGQGTVEQNLTDAWIYVNHNYYGAYELPTKIPLPLLENGNSEILILPGFRLNGMITNSAIYALLNPYMTTINLEQKKIDTIKPSTSYQDGLSFTIVDFDGRLFLDHLDKDGDVDTKIILSSPAEAHEGSNSGLIELTSAHPTLSTEDDINHLIIPQSVDPIILELSFKSDISFSIGFIGYTINSGGQDNLVSATLLPKANWTKVYFDFRTLINLSNSDYYHLAIEAHYDSANPLPTQRILLDNIKVIHR